MAETVEEQAHQALGRLGSLLISGHADAADGTE